MQLPVSATTDPANLPTAAAERELWRRSTVSTPDKESNEQGPGHIPALDGIRGVAILMVMGLHFSYGMPEDSHLTRFILAVLRVGWTGVDLFFVLSGFLITGILLREKSSPHFFRNFYARRILRIFPLYYGVLGVLAIAWRTVPSWKHDAGLAPMRADWPWYWFYATNYLIVVRQGFDTTAFGPLFLGHLWSLSIEEHFYIVWPFVVRFLTRRSVIVSSLVVIATAFGFRAAYVATGKSVWVTNFATQCRVDTLAIGALLAVVARSDAGRSFQRMSGWIAIAAAAMLIALAVRSGGLDAAAIPIRVVGLPLIALVYGYLVLKSAEVGSLFAKIFQVSCLRWFGRYSYGIYIFHLLFIAALTRSFYIPKLAFYTGHMSFGIILHYSGCIGVSSACAYISYHIYEKHFLNLKAWFR